MIASLSGHLPGGSPLPSWTNPKEPNFVSTSARPLLPSPVYWPFSGQQLRATTRGMATWSLLRSSTSAILSTLKTIPCWLAFRLIIEKPFALIHHLWPQARMWWYLWGWTPCHHNSSVIFFFHVRWRLLDTVLFTLVLISNSCHSLLSECSRTQDIISASTVTKDHDAIGHFRIVQKQKDKGEAERTSLRFPFKKQRKMQNFPLNVTLFFCSYIFRKWPIGELTHGFHVGQIETMIANHKKQIRSFRLT